MKMRYHLQNNTHMVEAPHSEQGHTRLKWFRDCRDLERYPDFKGRHIREVLQAYPSQIQPFKIYELT